MTTTDTTKPLDLDAIRKRADAATKGPWATGEPGVHLWEVRTSWSLPLIELDQTKQGEADAEFIAAARTDVPSLLAEIDRLRAELAQEDRAHTKTIEERDRYQEVADNLAHAIAAMTGVEIGEHSSMNDPWQNALDVAEGWTRAGAR